MIQRNYRIKGKLPRNLLIMSDLLLRRKWTFRAHGRQVVFIKKPVEHTHHVLMKAFLWALYLPQYPDLKVEVEVGDRYRPDVVAVDLASPHPALRFWGEAGQVGVEKIRTLSKGYPYIHFAIAKWETSLHPVVEIVKEAIAGRPRMAPFDLLNFHGDSAERFIDAHGEIHVRHEDLTWLRL